jgi:glycosyltransferase involved in cell wall biosynthesis
MRWIVVSARHHPEHGGIGAAVARFIEAACAAGWEVHLITRPGDRPPRGAILHPVQTIDHHPAFGRRIGALRRLERIRPYRYGLWSLAVARKLLELEPAADAIEFIDCQAEGHVALASRAVRRRWRGVPMLLGCHTPMWLMEDAAGCDPARFGRAIYHEWERQSLRSAEAVIAPSRMLLDRLSHDGPAAVIPNHLPPEPEPDPAAARQPLLLCAGDVQPMKGFDTWASSLNIVFDRHPEVRAVLAGADTPSGPGGSSMAAHVRSIIESRFRLRLQCIGPISSDEVHSIMRCAAAVVVPSRFESFSYIAAESLLAGAPVIVTNATGITEHVPSLPRVAAGDAEGLAKAQIAMLRDGTAAAQTAQRCRAELLDACEPRTLLAARQALAESCRCAQATRGTPGLARESITDMQQFLASIEADEQALHTACESAPEAVP